MHIVWFKRDLRLADHEALAQAAKLGPVLPLYILEPELWRQADMSSAPLRVFAAMLGGARRSRYAPSANELVSKGWRRGRGVAST